MAGNRKAAQEFIIKYVDKLAPGTANADNYRELFAAMDDKEFDLFINQLADGSRFLVVIIPNFSKTELNVERNVQIAKELGHDFFQKLWIEGTGDVPTYQTPVPYLIVDLPLRRASQLLTKKISVPKHNRVIDALTGQPTGESKGAKLSYPELQVLSAMGLEHSLVELMKYRGGDNRGRAALTGMLSRHGQANMKALAPFASQVASTVTLKTFLTSAHLKSTL
jgi:hypothetical protein